MDNPRNFFFVKFPTQCLDSVKTSCKLALFSDIDLQSENTGASGFSFDPATAEILIDLGRGLYKLMFQLLLLIESDNKILVSIVQNLRQNEKVRIIGLCFVLEAPS